MKRITAFLLAGLMVLSLCACSKDDDKKKGTNDPLGTYGNAIDEKKDELVNGLNQLMEITGTGSNTVD